MHPGLHCDVFDQIRHIPTGNYGDEKKTEPKFNASKMSQMANMNKTQLDDAFKNNFKTLFTDGGQSKQLIDEDSVLPKIVQL